jgi:ribosomal protein S18 acetylase RimI-like enzyme
MSGKIRHLERKILIYGTLSAILAILTLALYLAGMSLLVDALVIGAFMAALSAIYALFDRSVIWLLRAKLSGREDEPRAFRIVEDICIQAGYPMPALAILSGPTAAVFVTGVTSRKPVLLISRRLLDTLNDRELAIVVGHELEAVGEMGWFPYNTIMITFAALAWLVHGTRRIASGDKGDVKAWQNEHIVVDRATMQDVPAAVRLLIASGMYTSIYVNDLCRLAADHSPLFMVARCDGTPAGFIIGEVSGSAGHISKIVVDERFRRMGIGNLLLQTFVDAATKSGCRLCAIEVRTDNTGAISLYEKLAFSKERILPGYYPDGTACQIMVKPLKK